MNINPIKLIFSLSILVGIASCDRITQPIPEKLGTLDWSLFPDGDSAEYTWPVWQQNTNTSLNVLLEDYTGHTCTNCPAAAVIAKDLEDANPERVFVASVHASTTNGFQVPHPPELPTDFRTPEGTEFANTLDISFNPAGTVNRVPGGGHYWQLSSAWTGLVNAELAKTPTVNLQVQYNYYPQTRGLFVHSETELLDDLIGDHHLIIMLVRDSVIDAQEDVGGNLIEHYHHHSVLSKTINGIWGSLVVSTSGTNGDKFYNDYSYELPDVAANPTFDIGNLSLITFLCDRATYEVKQVVKTKLTL